MRQLIIARKDLGMSPGKLAAQVSHASMAFLTRPMRDGGSRRVSLDKNTPDRYEFCLELPADIYEQWICGAFVKTVCEARNRYHLMKAVTMAEELGLVEDKDFFMIKDNCLTELEPEEVDVNGVGRTLTCVGFRPLPDDIAHAISKKYQLYK